MEDKLKELKHRIDKLDKQWLFLIIIYLIIVAFALLSPIIFIYPK